MTDWLALLLLLATYVLALAFGSTRPATTRLRRPQFDPILPTPKRPKLRLLTREPQAAHG